mgnify:FL=1
MPINLFPSHARLFHRLPFELTLLPFEQTLYAYKFVSQSCQTVPQVAFRADLVVALTRSLFA